MPRATAQLLQGLVLDLRGGKSSHSDGVTRRTMQRRRGSIRHTELPTDRSLAPGR